MSFFEELEACRGCLRPGKSHHLFGEDDLFEKYKYCTQLKIDKDDGLAGFLCKLCYSHLQVAYNFKRMCKETHSVLKKLLQNPTKQQQKDEQADQEATELLEKIKEAVIPLPEPPDNKNLKSKYTESRLQCQLCGRRYSCPQALKNHMENTHKGMKRFSCDICSMHFTQKHSLQSHMLRHTNLRPFRCEVCQKGFRRKTTLQMHLNCHTGKTPYSCSRCNRSFRTTTALRNHGHNLRCPICDKTFQMIPSLQAHIRRHKQADDGGMALRIKVKHSCKECGKSYACRSVLEAHMVIHTGQKPFRCTECDKSFPLFASLKVHMRNKHPDSQTLICEICGEAFPDSGKFLKHKRDKLNCE